MNSRDIRATWAGNLRMRIRTGAAAIFLIGTLGITVPSGDGPRPALDADAREFVRLAVALGERDADSLDFYAGPPDLVADVRAHPPSLASIERSVDAAIAHLERADGGVAQRLRRDRLVRELHALRARVALLLGDQTPYDVESKALFGVAPAPADDRRFSEIRSRIDALLPAGASPLVDRYAAYDSRFTVAADRVPAVFARALTECRSRALAHLRLPADEGVTVEYVDQRPWGAYSRYSGGGHSVISINTGFRFTVDRLLQAACHEGYPGHHVRNVLREARAGCRRFALEWTVQPLFSPETLIAEGSAMYAVDVAFSQADRAQFERDQLFPTAGITGEDADGYVRIARLVDDLQEVQVQIARQYLDGALEFARAASALEEQALMRESGAMLKYMNEFRSYITAYTTGRQAAVAFVESCAGSADREKRWKCFEQLLTPN